jgi:hypothetical protein
MSNDDEFTLLTGIINEPFILITGTDNDNLRIRAPKGVSEQMILDTLLDCVDGLRQAGIPETYVYEELQEEDTDE